MKHIKIIWKDIRVCSKYTKALFALFAVGSLLLGMLTVLAFSDWFLRHRDSQAAVSRIEAMENKSKLYEKATIEQEDFTPVQNQLRQQAVQVRPNNDANSETEDVVSESDQREIDRINEQIRELKRAKNDSDYEATKPLEITPLEIKPITVPDIDTTIKTQPIDGTIRPTNRPADVCASSAAKFLPECK